MSEPGSLRARLAAASPASRAAVLLAHVCTRAAHFVGAGDTTPVPADAPWTELGFDSLRAVDFGSELAHDLGLALRSTLLFDQPVPRALTAHLLSLMHLDEPAVAPAHDASAGEPLAIVGAGCRFPGGEDLDGFWRLLVEGRDAVGPIPPERFAIAAADGADQGTARVRDAALLRDIDLFDAAFFGISPREATELDPQQRLLLEVAWHALEHAGVPPRSPSTQRTGVYVGIRTGEYFESQAGDRLAAAGAWHQTGNQLSTAAGRLAFTFGFTGPCFAIDTACSGSLVAVHVAARALRARECDIALAGGVNVVLDPVAMVALERARMLAADGRCKAFAAAADGYGRGEGCGLVVMKRLADARAAGDRILAVVAGTAINQDGRSAGLTVPSGPAQAAVIRAALADAALAPSAIDFVEAHGTGTQLGDPLEAGALDDVFGGRGRPLPIGSVKTNIGHLEAAAGISGLIKVVLALQARMLPPSLHCLPPSPHIDWTRSVLRVAKAPLPLPRDGVLHAGVSSFGFSGTNCHVVLASPPAPRTVAQPVAAARGRPWLLALQAADDAALRELAALHARALAEPGIDLGAWCHAAAVGRAALPVRAAFVAATARDLATALTAFANGDDGAGRPAVSDGDGPLRVAAAAFVRGEFVDLAEVNGTSGPPAARLPDYPFQRRRFWLERREPVAARPASHPLLGVRCDSSLVGGNRLLFTKALAATAPAWLTDHRVQDRALLPFAAMIEMVLAAEAAAGTPLPLAVRDVSVRASIALDEQPVAVEVVRTATASGARFALSSRDASVGWRAHCEGASGPAGEVPRALDLAAIRRRCRDELPVAALHEHCARLQLHYGPAFRGVRRIHRGAGEVFAEVELPSGCSPTPFFLHPALLDACLHIVVAALPPDGPPFLPISVDEIAVFAHGVRGALCHCRWRSNSGRRCVADYDLCDAEGRVLATVRGLRLDAVKAPPTPAIDDTGLLHHVAWRPVAPPAPGPSPSRLAIVGWARLAHAIAARLPAAEVRVAVPETLPSVLDEQRPDTVLFLAEPHAGDDADPLGAQQRLLGSALETIHATLRARHTPRLGVVTHGVQPAGFVPVDAMPHAGSLLGLWRTLAIEHPATRPFAIDLDPTVPCAREADHAPCIVAELCATGAETEVAWRVGERHVRRVQRGSPADRLVLPETPFRVRSSGPSFERLECRPLQRRAPGPGEVEVAIVAAALNWKDVLCATGRLLGAVAEPPLGYEACGTVVAVGHGVADLRVGDTVALLGDHCLATHATVARDRVFVVPAGADARAVAGMPVVFATVLHALHELANVQRGETVLVHAAAGGTGQAAIQVLRAAGCRVLATASPGKQALVRALGAEAIGDSRRHEFGSAVMAATAGRGADVVLDTLGGEAIAPSLAALARGGRFVELGKIAVWSAERVRQQRSDVRYFAFDLGDEFARDPALRVRLLDRVRAGLAAGTLRPVRTAVAAIEHVRRAFRAFAGGRTVGKVVLAIAPVAQRLRADRSYLLTGAAGGIAPAIGNALADAGARQLALLSRHALDDSLAATLRARGCEVLVLQADVADRDALAAALRTLRERLLPLGGIVHAAGATADAMLASLDWAQAATALPAKIAGTIWLGELTAADPVEFLAITSSIASTLGNAGQAAYAAANAFAESFAAWRVARGRPATAIAFGPWDGPGMTGRLDAALRARVVSHGFGLLPPAVASRLLVQQRAVAGEVVVMDRRDEIGVAPGDSAAPDVRAVPAADRAAVLRAAVRTQIAKALGFHGPEQLVGEGTFRDLGLDSLLAVEAKDRLESLVGRPLPASLLFDHSDLDSLVAHLLTTIATG